MELESSRSGNRIHWSGLLLIAGAAALGMLLYLLQSAATYRLGFPLDDSWIHATFARSLALRGEWAFRPGQPSAGSTAPLWTLLLAPGYWLGLAPLFWSHILGYVALAGLGVFAERTARIMATNYRPRVPWIGLFFVTEWHLLWAASSGMETLPHAVLSTIVLVMVIRGSRRYATMGVLVGLCVWLRPDALLLLLPTVIAVCAQEQGLEARRRALLPLFAGFGGLLLPFVFFNLTLSGRPLPNTYYAKQAEYAAWQARLIWGRAGLYLLQASAGSLLLLWPGVVLWAIRVVRTKAIASAGALLWCGIHIGVYVLELPPYQHGRYIMPTMPPLLLMGLLGYLQFVRLGPRGTRRWVMKEAWRFSIAAMCLLFLFLGARAYARDVGLIESEMVNTSRWVSTNIPAGATIAAHDIGALGFFDDHELLDLAGLISPEVVPFMRNQERLATYLDQRGANYLVAFPDLYPDLVAVSKPVYSGGGAFAPSMGENNMEVYCWRCR